MLLAVVGGGSLAKVGASAGWIDGGLDVAVAHCASGVWFDGGLSRCCCGRFDDDEKFNCEASPCDLIGMNSELMTEYIEFVADCRVKGAVDAVRQFNCAASPCDLIGMNSGLMTNRVRG